MWNNYYDSYYGYYGGPYYPGIVYGVTHRSYTMRLEEILKLKHPELDPIDSDQLLQAGLDTIFKNMNLNVLTDQYKDTFIVQFLNEFYMYEIGQETIDFFRQNLNKTIQNHGNYIRSLYEMAEKKYFVQYSYRTNEGNSTQDTTTSGQRDINNSSESEVTASDSRNISRDGTADTTNSGNRTADNTDSRNGTLNSTNDSTVDDTSNMTTSGEDERNDTGGTTRDYDETSNGKYDINRSSTSTGESTETDTNHSTTQRDSTNTQNGSTDTTIEASKTANDKAIQRVSDTPQNGLKSVEEMTYLSAAQVNTDDASQNENSTQNVVNKNNTVFGETYETNANGSKSGNTSSTDSGTEGNTHSDDRNVDETVNENRTSKGTSSGTQDVTAKTVTKGTGSQTTEDSGTSHTEETTGSTQKVVDKATEAQEGNAKSNTTSSGHVGETNSGTTNTAGKTNGTEEYYTINRDAVFMTNDITDKIWELFSDCFMLVG